MALLDFPSGPTQDVTTYTNNGNTWKWNGTSWVAFNNLSLSSQVSGILAVQYGGTGFGGTYNKGDILYALSSNTFGKLAAGTAGSVLSINGSQDLYWKADDSGTGSVGNGTAWGFAYYNNSTNTITSGSGFSYISGTTNVVLTNGLLSLPGSTINSGVWAGTAISLANGGTNANLTAVNGGVVYSTASAMAISDAGNANEILKSNGAGAPTWVAQSTLTAGSASTSTRSNTFDTTSVSASTTYYFVGSTSQSGANAVTPYTSGTGVSFDSNSVTATTFRGNASTASTATRSNTFDATLISNSTTYYLVGTTVSSNTNAVTPYTSGTGVTFDNSSVTATTFRGNATSATTAGTATSAVRAGVLDLLAVSASTTYYLTGNTSQNAANSQAQYTSGTGVSFDSNSVTATTFRGNASTASTSTRSNTFDTTSVSASTTYYFVGSTSQSGANAVTPYASGTGVSFDSNSVTATTFRGNASTATKATNISGGTSSAGSSIIIQTAVDTTGFLAHPGSAGYALTTTSNGLVYGALSSIAVTSLSAGNGIQVSSSTGYVTVSNIGVTSITGTANRVTVSASGTGGTGAVTLTTPQDIHTSASPSFADITITTGSSSTLATVGSSATSIVNKQYVDNLASGLDVHGSVRLVSVAAIGASYYQPNYGIGNTATGAYLTSIGNATFPAIDGVTIGSTGVNQRVLIAGGLTGTGKTSINGSALVTPANSNLVNGIYYVGSVGSGSSQWYLYRATDTDDNTELTAGTFCFIEEGDSYADSGFVCTNDTTNFGPIQFGSTAILFTQFTGGGALGVGQGLTKVGNTIAAKVNLFSTGTASGTGFTQFNIGGAGSAGVADTGYYPTFSVRTSGTVAGAATLTLNDVGFSLLGSTSTPATLTVVGNISLPNPGTQYQLAFASTANSLGFLGNAAGSGASVLTQTGNATPVWAAQSQLLVGIASSSVFSNITGDNTSTLYLLGSKSSGGFAGTAIYVDSGISALGNTITAVTFSGTATTATRALNTDITLETANQIYLTGSRSNSSIGSTPTYVVSGVSALGNTITAVTFSGTASIASSSVFSNITGDNTGTLYLLGSKSSGGFAGTAIYVDSGISALGNTITAVTFSGTATTATRVGITTTVTDDSLPIVFASNHQPSAALGSSTRLTINPSTGKITNGFWAGTAITTTYGGTGLNTVNANQVLIGAATGNTWAAIASTNLPVVGIGSNPPAPPLGAIGATQAGQLWWDSEYGVLKVYYVDATPTAQWVDATPVLGSSGGGSSTKRSYVMTFGAGFTPSTGADTVQILIPYAPDNTSKYYYIKRLDYRANTAGTGVSFYMERFTGGNAEFNVATGNRIHSGAGASFVTSSGTFTTSYTQSSSGASFVSSSGVAGSVISGDYLRLNFSHINSAATMSVSMILEEQ